VAVAVHAVGVVRDPQFGANVMLGVGGVLAEAVADVVFRPVPISAVDAEEMIDGLATQKLLGAFRGEAAVDRAALAGVLLGLSKLASDRPDVVSVDVNPLIVAADGPNPVDHRKLAYRNLRPGMRLMPMGSAFQG